MLPFDALVLNKYRILRAPGRRDGLLGRGTYGSVYLAYEELADRNVAIKVLNIEQGDRESTQEEALRRFLTEGRLGLRVRHPNILEVYAIEPYEDGYLLVMELAEAGDLKGLFSRERPTQATAVQIGVGIARGLQAAHEHDIIHRDLKPGNVFLTRNQTPKVADFGVAHIPSAVGGYMSLTRTGFQPGTIIYMSPEQAAGRRIDHRSDLYALAVMMYEALAGRFYVDLQRCREEAQSRSGSTPALEELRFFQVFSEVAFTGEIPSLRDVNPAVPVWLDEVILRGLARDPNDRWQSGNEFAAALLAGGPLSTAAPLLPETEQTLIEPLTPQIPRPPRPGVVQPPPYLPPDSETSGTATSSSARYLRPLRPTTIDHTPSNGVPAEVAASASGSGVVLEPAARAAQSDSLNGRAPAAEEIDSTIVDRSAASAGSAPANGAAVPVVPAIPAFGAATSTERMPATDSSAPPAVRPPAVEPTEPEVALAGKEAESGTIIVTPPTESGASATPASAPPTSVATPPAPPVTPPPATGGGSRLPLIGALVAVLVLLLGGGGLALAHPWSSGSKPKPSPSPEVVASASATATATAPATVVASASPSPSPSPSPTPSPTPNAQTVGDAAITRPDTTLAQRYNVPGRNGDPGYVVAYTLGAATADGCRQPYIDLLRPGSGGGAWNRVWEATAQPQGSPAIDTVKKADNGCFPKILTLQAKALAPNGPLVPLLIVGLADGSARVVAVVDEASGTPKLQFDLHTTPNATVSLSSELPVKLSLSESVYPPPGSGLNPQYSQPIGSVALVYDWGNGTFTQEGAGDVTLGCLNGTISAVGQQGDQTTLLLQCPDGSPAPYSAVLLDGNTKIADGVTAGELQAGDDVTVTVDATALKASDPLNVLPAATTAQSNAALKRKKAREAPTPAPTAPPRPSGGGSTSGGTSSGGTTYTPPASNPAPSQPVYTPPQPQPQPQPQPVPSGGGSSSGSGGGSAGGGSSGGGGGLGGGSGTGTGSGGGGGLGGGSSSGSGGGGGLGG
jgi:serine/threonine-protein kinase